MATEEISNAITTDTDVIEEEPTFVHDNLLEPTDVELEDFSIERIDDLQDMIHMIKEMMIAFEMIWNDTRTTYELTSDQMVKVSQYNKANRDPKPDDYDEDNLKEDEEPYDQFNGINKMTKDDVLSIFGEGHKIISPLDHDVTIQHIKEAAEELTNYVTARENYHQTTRAYLMLIDMREDYELSKLEKEMEDKSPEEQEIIKTNVEKIKSQKNIDFLPEIFTKEDNDYIVKAQKDEKKIQYLFNRTIDKMDRLGFSKGMILEFNNFEKRYLPEEYHDLNNLLLTYLLKMIAYSNPSNPNDEKINQARLILLAVDGIVRNTLVEERKQRVLDNIIKFCDKIDSTVLSK